MRAAVLFEALAILRAAKDAKDDAVPGVSWHRIMTAHNNLEYALMQEGLTLPVEAEKPQGVAA